MNNNKREALQGSQLGTIYQFTTSSHRSSTSVNTEPDQSWNKHSRNETCV